MRTWPAPSILPSMVKSEAISDSLLSARSGVRRGTSGFKGVIVDISGLLPAGSLGGAAATFGSFHNAMVIPHFIGQNGTTYIPGVGLSSNRGGHTRTPTSTWEPAAAAAFRLGGAATRHVACRVRLAGRGGADGERGLRGGPGYRGPIGPGGSRRACSAARRENKGRSPL